MKAKVTPEQEEFMRQYVENYDTTYEHYPYALPIEALKFANFDQMVRAVRESGSHFFDRDAIEFFNGKVYGELYGGRFFITREHPDEDAPAWTVRYVCRYPVNTCLQVESLGGFREFNNKENAVAFAKHAVVVLFGKDEL